MQMIRAISEECQCAVLIIAHPSRAGMETGSGDSGNTAWHNNCRARYYMKRDPEDKEIRILKDMKGNLGPDNEPMRLFWKDWIFVRDDLEEGVTGAIQRRNSETVFLELLDRLEAGGRVVSRSHQSTNYAPKVMSLMPGNTLSYDQLKATMERLYRAGSIEDVRWKNENRKFVDVIKRAKGASNEGAF